MRFKRTYLVVPLTIDIDILYTYFWIFGVMDNEKNPCGANFKIFIAQEDKIHNPCTSFNLSSKIIK